MHCLRNDMGKYKFKNHDIQRNCNQCYQDYHGYKQDLQKDFSHRCAYCNLKDDRITSYFDIDHFVPKDEFKKYSELSYLKTDYKNLIYSCHKCNLAKGQKFEGDLQSNPYENRRFYNPVDTDYNTIFFRDEKGNIKSDDKLGVSMIQDLKLYQPIHNLNWICERLDLLCDMLDRAIESEDSGSERRKLLEEAHYKALKYKKKCDAVFIANYNNTSFSLD